MRRALAGLALAAALAAAAAPLQAKVLLSTDEALAQAFPEADRIVSERRVLDAEQAKRVESLARSTLPSREITLYQAFQGDRRLGTAFLDVHTVRRLPEALLVVLDPEGSVRSVRVVAFHEPLDYLPTERWYRQFEGRGPDDRPRLGRDIHGIAGATLSARAATAAVRRALALHRVLIRGEDG